VVVQNDADLAQSSRRALVWTFKSSFVDYIARMNDGLVIASDEATRRADGAFVFPGSASPRSTSAKLCFNGNAEFSGHFGMLYISISNPCVEERSNGLFLSIDDSETAGERIDFALLADHVRHDTSVEFEKVTLTHAGADVFFDNYPAGTELDPLVIEGLSTPASHETRSI
jgi:hypothetical protein